VIFSVGEWKPIYNNLSGSKERISVMQIAFRNQIFLLDILDFLHQCDEDQIQKRLAERLFDDDHVTILCKLNRFDFKFNKIVLTLDRLWF